MAKPIVEQIAAAVKTKLATISKANGYETDVVEVVRPTRLGGGTTKWLQPRDKLIVLIQDDPQEAEVTQNQARKTWIQPFGAMCFVRPSDASTTPVDTIINAFRADVEKAVMTDRNWSGLAIDTEVWAPEGFIDEKNIAFEGVTVAFAIKYRTLYEDPYQQ